MSILRKSCLILSFTPTLLLALTLPFGFTYAATVTLDNPLRVGSLEALLVAILNIFTILMIPIIVFFIILAGFRYVTAQGNPGQIEEATTTFTYAIIGGVLVLAAVAIAEIISNTVAEFQPDPVDRSALEDRR
jgi:hypothetical protein